MRTAFVDLTPRQAAIVVAGLLGIVAVAWRVIAVGMWPCLAGRKLVSNGIALASWGLLVVAAIVGSWIYRHPELHPRLLGALPWVVGVLLSLKLTAAVAAFYWLLKLNLAETSNLVKSFLGWCAIVAALFCGLSQLVPASWPMAAWIVLLVPLTRIAIAPLALHVNRHR